MTAGVTAKYSELVLQGYDIELPGVQEDRRPFVFFELFVVDLQANDGRIVVLTTLVGHRHDGGVRTASRCGDCLLKIGRKRGNSAATGERIADESYTAR
jgi:hypothetical protein